MPELPLITPARFDVPPLVSAPLPPEDVAHGLDLARGAVWHATVALPEIQASANGGADAVMPSLARAHVERAAADLGSLRDWLRAHGELGVDARTAVALATQHEPALRTALSAGDDGFIARAAALLPSAIVDAQAGVERLIGAAAGHASLLPITPAELAPRDDLAHVTSAAAARAFRVPAAEQRSFAEWLLANGTLDDEPARRVAGNSNKGERALRVETVRHPDNPAIAVQAVHRMSDAQAAQEDEFYTLAKAAGVDQYLAPTARRPDGSVLVGWAPGTPAGELGVASAADVQRTIATWYRQRFPGLGEDQVQLAATVDRQVLQFLDYLLAQSDRHPGNALAEPETGEYHHFDNGYAGRGELGDPLRPAIRGIMLDGEPRVQLWPDSVEAIRKAITPQAISAAHQRLLASSEPLPEGQANELRQDASPAALGAKLARLDSTLATSGYDFTPIPLWGVDSDPVRYPRRLNGGRSPFARRQQ